MTDTRQQKAILRQCATARKVRRMFPKGTLVAARDVGPDAPVGVVERHVPSTNAQGGYLVVRWPNGAVGRHGPIALRIVDSGGWRADG